MKLRIKKGRRIKIEKRGAVEAPIVLSTFSTPTRQCLRIQADTSLNGESVVRILESLVEQYEKRPYPKL